MSGKGGVGKSTTVGLLAVAAVRRGLRVGILDIDLCGPSQPRLFGLEGNSIHQSELGWVPVYTDTSKSLGVVSLGFLVAKKDDPVIWRGPKKTSSIQSFLSGVFWGQIDLLLIDTPPGTSDEHISVVESLMEMQRSPDNRVHLDGALIVTTPQRVSLSDVQKEISFCNKMHLPMLGIVENMSGFRCPECSECSYIFASGGGQLLASQHNLPLVGPLPIDPKITALADAGQLSLWHSDDESDPTLVAFSKVLDDLFINP